MPTSVPRSYEAVSYNAAAAQRALETQASEIARLQDKVTHAAGRCLTPAVFTYPVHTLTYQRAIFCSALWAECRSFGRA